MMPIQHGALKEMRRIKNIPCLYLVNDAYSNIVEVLRYKEIRVYTNEIIRVYAALTDNQYLNSFYIDDAIRPFSDDESHVSNTRYDFRNEMHMFVRLQFIALTKRFLSRVKSAVLCNVNDDMEKGCVRLGNKVYNQNEPLTLSELSIITFECETLIGMYENEMNPSNYDCENKYIVQGSQQNIYALLNFLIKKFEGCGCITASNDKRSPFRVSPEYDIYSIQYLISLGVMISDVVRSILNVRCFYSKNEISAVAHKCIEREYQQYTTIGSMAISSIFCCFGYPKLLELCVQNRNGSLTTDEKIVLFNTLVLSKLL